MKENWLLILASIIVGFFIATIMFDDIVISIIFGISIGMIWITGFYKKPQNGTTENQNKN